MAFVAKRAPAFKVVEISRASLLLVLCTIVIIAGIALFSVKGWARWLAVIGGTCIILLQVGYTVYTFGFVLPARELWQQQQEEQLKGSGGPFAPPRGASSQSGYKAGYEAGKYLGGGGMTLLLTVPYVVAILLLFTPSASKAFAGQQRRGPGWDEEEDFDEEEDRPPPRRRFRRDDDEDDDYD